MQETPVNVSTDPVAPISQVAGAQQALPIQATETVEDPVYSQAVAAVVQTGTPTVSTIQTALNIGYKQASELLTRMELEGVISRPDPKTMQRKVMIGQAPEVVTPSGLTFTTAKGSTYAVNDDGTTTRSKAARPEQPGEEGLQPTSTRCSSRTKN